MNDSRSAQGNLQRPLQLLILDGVVERLQGKKTDITFSDKYDKYGQCPAAVSWRFDNISQQQNHVFLRANWLHSINGAQKTDVFHCTLPGLNSFSKQSTNPPISLVTRHHLQIHKPINQPALSIEGLANQTSNK